VALLEKGRAEESLAHLQTAVQLDSHDADAHYNLGNTFLAMGRAREALAQYQTVLEINPDDTQAMNNMAWILATSPDPMIRDGIRAVAVAERAVRLTENKAQRTVATLAAAYAEMGRFPEAVKTAQRALQLALNEGNNARADSIRSQIARYESGAAFRERRY
jgi:Flp pilus assembly protein TadD